MLGPLTLAVALPFLPAANALVRKNDVVCSLLYIVTLNGNTDSK